VVYIWVFANHASAMATRISATQNSVNVLIANTIRKALNVVSANLATMVTPLVAQPTTAKTEVVMEMTIMLQFPRAASVVSIATATVTAPKDVTAFADVWGVYITPKEPTVVYVKQDSTAMLQ